MIKKNISLDWLPDYIDIDPFSKDKYELLYTEYLNIQKKRPLYLGLAIYIPFHVDPSDPPKHEMFFHLTTKDYTYKKRLNPAHEGFDFERSKRLNWIPKVIENYSHSDVSFFIYDERHYLFLEKERYVVVLAKSRKYSEEFPQFRLITAFYIDHESKFKQLKKRCDIYTKTASAKH